MIVCNGEAKKVDLKTDSTISAGVYPSWHPKLNLIAYSTNLTGQGFHTKSTAKIDVQDTRSDLILYNIDKNEVSNISAIKNELEVFPWWAPDGKSIYFCSAHFEYRDTTSEETQMIERYHEVKHNIYRKPFDEKTMTFGDTELVYNAEKDSMSATFPRISPDGRYLLFALGNHGCFHVWHPEADLYLTDLTTMQTRKLENINSAQSESYHSWSSNGRWIVVGSRRDDGNYTRPYIAYFDKQGKAHKPFILPQEDPDFYRYFMRSFNIPEFMKEPVAISPQGFAEVARTEALKANFKSTEQNHGVLQESVSKYDSIRVDGMTGASPKRPESKDHTVN
jgi:Tol biopolymer transport system component